MTRAAEPAAATEPATTTEPAAATEVAAALPPEALREVDTVFLDLDGCVWFGSELAPGAADLVRDLRASGRRVGFLSNTSNSRAATVAAKLAGLGIPSEPDDVLMPIEVLSQHPRMRGRPPTWVLGTAEVHAGVRELTRVVDDPAEAELVILSRDPELTYADLADALQPLLAGAPLLALNLDARVPVDGGRIVPGTGALAAALETAGGVRAELVGKPSRFFFEAALERFGAEPGRTLMVGDMLDVDIAGGLAAGLWTAHVGGDGASAHDPAPVPHCALEGIAQVRSLLDL